MIRNACAFTGHRPEKMSFGNDEDDVRCTALKSEIEKQIEAIQLRGIDAFITGCARGVDTWAAEIVYERMKDKGRREDPALYAYVPYAGQAEYWGKADRERWRAVRDKCTRAFVLQPQYTQGCFHLRNRKMVEACRCLLAVYDETSRFDSGTAYTVAYARKRQKSILLLHPETLKTTYEWRD